MLFPVGKQRGKSKELVKLIVSVINGNLTQTYGNSKGHSAVIVRVYNNDHRKGNSTAIEMYC